MLQFVEIVRATPPPPPCASAGWNSAAASALHSIVITLRLKALWRGGRLADITEQGLGMAFRHQDPGISIERSHLHKAKTSESHLQWGLQALRLMDAAICTWQRRLQWRDVGSVAGCTLFLGDFISSSCGILQHAAGIVCNTSSGAIIRVYNCDIRRCPTFCHLRHLLLNLPL
jgi:hypothetical protein